MKNKELSKIIEVSKILCPDSFHAANLAVEFAQPTQDYVCKYIDPAIEGYRRLDFQNKHYFRIITL